MLSPALAERIERWPRDRLIPYAGNPRKHSDQQVAQIAASSAQFDFLKPILVDTNSGIITGHGRLLAARKLKLREVPVVILDHPSEDRQRVYLIADNELALAAGWDEELLSIESATLQNKSSTHLVGFDDEELARLLAVHDAVEGLTDQDADLSGQRQGFRLQEIFGCGIPTTFSICQRPACLLRPEIWSQRREIACINPPFIDERSVRI
jgi:ParB-like chromosome segregation protein Spo0J